MEFSSVANLRSDNRHNLHNILYMLCAVSMTYRSDDVNIPYHASLNCLVASDDYQYITLWWKPINSKPSRQQNYYILPLCYMRIGYRVRKHHTKPFDEYHVLLAALVLKPIFAVVFTAWSSHANAVLGIVILSLCLSVTRVLCDETKEHTADISTPRERVHCTEKAVKFYG